MSSELLLRLLALKQVQRKGWTRFAIPTEAIESVADHSYSVALLVCLLCPEELDRQQALEMALFHDLAEVMTGDIIPSEGVPEETKARDELNALAILTKDLGWEERATALLRKYQSQSTPEARFVKAIDKLDMALQSLAYENEFPVNLQEFRESAKGTLEKSGLWTWLKESGVRNQDSGSR